MRMNAFFLQAGSAGEFDLMINYKRFIVEGFPDINKPRAEECNYHLVKSCGNVNRTAVQPYKQIAFEIWFQ